jgi:DNA-binding transcriptional LysR family regulator
VAILRGVDLEDLRAFVAVADTGSFLAAAGAVRMPRSTLRRRVNALEARAGVPLLEGTPGGVVLTDAGLALAAQGRRMMQEMRAVLASVRDLGATPRGTLRLVLPVGMPPQAVAMVLAGMRAAHPDLHYHCRFSNDPAAEPLDDVDLAVHFDDDAPGPAWVSFPIARIHRGLLASAEYLEKHGAPRHVDDLASHELLAWQAPGEDGSTWALRGGGSVRVRPVLIASDVHIVRICCAAGQGIAHVPDAGMPHLTGAAPLVRVLEDMLGSEIVVRASVPRALAGVPRVRAVVDRLEAIAGSALPR